MSTGNPSREDEVLSLLSSNPGLAVSAISKLIGVSDVTVRKVLERLEAKGLIFRSHGRAVSAFHPDILSRQNDHVEEKNRIARAAAGMIGDGDTIMINSSTTAVLIARYLMGRRVRIVTNSTLILPFARMNPLLNVTLIGAEFRPATEALVGQVALEMLQQYHARFAFIGTAGFSVENGVTAHVAEEAAVVKKLTERSDETILLSDSSKFGKAGFVCFLRIDEVRSIISDTGLDDRAVTRLQEVGVTVTRV